MYLSADHRDEISASENVPLLSIGSREESQRTKVEKTRVERGRTTKSRLPTGEKINRPRRRDAVIIPLTFGREKETCQCKKSAKLSQRNFNFHYRQDSKSANEFYAYSTFFSHNFDQSYVEFE